MERGAGRKFTVTEVHQGSGTVGLHARERGIHRGCTEARDDLGMEERLKPHRRLPVLARGKVCRHLSEGVAGGVAHARVWVL